MLNILPTAIAQRLKQDRSPIAEQFSDVTILFADLVGFTPLSARLSPIQLVDLLNRLFSEFDRLAEQFGLGDLFFRGVPTLLGHNSTKTTEIYTHVAETSFKGVEDLLS